MLASWVLLLVAVCVPAVRPLGYRTGEDADFVIGAILPLSLPGCTDVDPKGSALAEGIVRGFEYVERESHFAFLRSKAKIGYDIRDNCGSPDITREHAHNIAGEALQYKKTQKGTKPVDVVISAFTNDDISSLAALDGAEILAAASYASDNARLVKTAENQYKIGKLVSAYPEESKKILAVGEIIEEFRFKYVYVVADDNVEGDDSVATLKKELADNGICVEELEGSWTDMVKQIKNRELVKVVVVSLPEDQELEFYQTLENNTVTDLTIITTQGFEDEVASLAGLSDVVEGGFDVVYARKNQEFKEYMTTRALPYTGRDWFQRAYLGFGGNASCFTNAGSNEASCVAAKDELLDALVENADDAEYAYHAVLAMAYAQQKSLETGEGFLETVKGLHVDIPVLAMDNVRFNDELSASISIFDIKNLQMKDKKLTNRKIGQWDQGMGKDALNMRKGDLQWSGPSGASKDVPKSVCSAACAMGFVRKFKDRECCWDCEQCPNGTVSNVTNAKTCHSCPEGTVVRPDQSGCKAYELNYFEWFGGAGAVVIVLMVIGVALVLFGLGVFSQNSHHEVVVSANYNSLCVFLLALLLLIFSPVPLLVKIPTGGSCSAYILMFNLGVSIVLGVFASRSAWLNGFFDDNGELTKGTLGRYPRTAVVVAVAVLQLIIMIVSFSGESTLTVHNLTDAWDQRYHECSSWASSAFWAGFTFNIVISVVGNSMSCSSNNVADNVYELKYILLGHLMWYMWGLVDLIVFFRCNDEHLAGGQSIVACLMAISFFIVYAWPKMYAILFQSKGGKLLPQEEEEEDVGIITEASAVSSKAGLTGHGIVSVKIREE